MYDDEISVTLVYTVEAAYYNRGCYQSAIVIKISGSKTLHLKSIKNKPFIIINLSVIVIKLQITYLAISDLKTPSVCTLCN